jgi:ubiquinone/menaquinone biosynthesis C-methylase UbiE
MTEAENKLAGACLVGAMWWYATYVLYPSQYLKHAGLTIDSGASLADLTIDDRPGLGPNFSRLHAEPVLLSTRSDHDHLVEEFDRMAEVYAEFVQPFSRPIFDEALTIMSRFLKADARVLDSGCGPGRELLRVARLVPKGEVVGIDLAARMVTTAHRAVRASGLNNCAFFQADAGALPQTFKGQFDVIYNCLAHHHYPDPPAAAVSALRCLRDGGYYCVIDPGPEWYNRMSAGLAKWADPGWISFHTPDRFRSLLQEAGFARVLWFDLLPGFGLVVGEKARPAAP